VRKLVKDLMKQSKKSRANIADEMSQRARRGISKRMIDDWVSPKTRARFPAALIEIFCEVIGNDALQRHVMSPRLLELVQTGERVRHMDVILRQMLEAVEKLKGRQSQKAKREKR